MDRSEKNLGEDRILLEGMVFHGRHGVLEHEQRNPQRFEVDLELRLNLQPAGVDDDIDRTVDYARAFDVTRQIVESTTFRLLEALAEAISHEILSGFPLVDEVGVRVRKPEVVLGGRLDWSGVEVWRRRPDG